MAGDEMEWRDRLLPDYKRLWISCYGIWTLSFKHQKEKNFKSKCLSQIYIQDDNIERIVGNDLHWSKTNSIISWFKKIFVYLFLSVYYAGEGITDPCRFLGGLKGKVGQAMGERNDPPSLLWPQSGRGRFGSAPCCHITSAPGDWDGPLISLLGTLMGEECPEGVTWVVLVILSWCWLHCTSREIPLPILASCLCLFWCVDGLRCFVETLPVTWFSLFSFASFGEALNIFCCSR